MSRSDWTAAPGFSRPVSDDPADGTGTNPALDRYPLALLVSLLALGGCLSSTGSTTLVPFSLAFSAYGPHMTGPVRMLTYIVTPRQIPRSSVIRVFEHQSTRVPALAKSRTRYRAAAGRYRLRASNDVRVRLLSVAACAVSSWSAAGRGRGETVAVVGGAGSGKSTLACCCPPECVSTTRRPSRSGSAGTTPDVTRDSLAPRSGCHGGSFLFSTSLRRGGQHRLRAGLDATDYHGCGRTRAAQGRTSSIVKRPKGGYDPWWGEQRTLPLFRRQRRGVALARFAGPDPPCCARRAPTRPSTRACSADSIRLRAVIRADHAYHRATAGPR